MCSICHLQLLHDLALPLVGPCPPQQLAVTVVLQTICSWELQSPVANH
jgi:hypothetical protein